jgi:hypothetical protein
MRLLIVYLDGDTPSTPIVYNWGVSVYMNRHKNSKIHELCIKLRSNKKMKYKPTLYNTIK